MPISCRATPGNAPHRLGLGDHVVTAHAGAPLSGQAQGSQDADCGAFARAVRSEEAENLARAHLERNALDRSEVAVALHKVLYHDLTIGLTGHLIFLALAELKLGRLAAQKNSARVQALQQDFDHLRSHDLLGRCLEALGQVMRRFEHG